MLTRPLPAALLALLLTAPLVSCDRSRETAGASAREETAPPAAAESTSMADIPTDQSRSGPTKNETYFLEVVPEPNPIPFQELFSLKVRVLDPDDQKTPLEGVELDAVRATMPAHDHGMKTAPEISSEEPGIFTVRGMRFHMRGEGEDGRWVLQLVVNGQEGIDEAKFDVQCCRPDQ